MRFFDKREFKDKTMYRELVLFAKEEQKDGGNHIPANINKILTPLIKKLSVKDLNDKWLIELEEKNMIPSGSKAQLCRFLGCMIQKGLIVDKQLKRISECKTSLYKSVMEGQLELLLTTNIYKSYKEMNDLTKHEEVSVLLRVINKTKNQQLDNAIEEYTNELKLTDSLSLSTKSARLSATNGLINSFFSVIKIDELTKNKLLEYINSTEFSREHVYPLLEILIIANKNKLIKDVLLQHYLTEVRRIYSNRNHDGNKFVSNILEFLSSFTEYSRLFLKVEGEDATYLSRLIHFEIKDYHMGTLLGNYFMESSYKSKTFNHFFYHFQDSVENQQSESLTFELFQHQTRYYKENVKNYKVIRHLINFYRYLMQNELAMFSDITEKRFLNRRGLSQELYNGFDIIFYQPLESIPQSDKWIISYNEQQCTNEGITSSMTYRIDFSVIQNSKYKYALKHFIWNQESSINNKIHQRKYILNFLKFCEDYQSTKVAEISEAGHKENKISLGLIIGYKNYILQKYSNGRTIISHIYSTRGFLKHVKENKLLKIDKGYDYYLTYTRDTTYNNSQPIPKQHMDMLFDVLKKESDRSVINMLYMSVFYLLSVTELRISNVLALRKNCIKTIGVDEHVILTETKTSNKEIIEIPIMLEVKEQISAISNVTEQYRKESQNERTNKYLFLTKGSLTNQYSVLSIQQFNKYLKKTCVELGLPKYTSSNLRDTHMTNIENFIIEKNYSELYQNTLSGHKSSNVDKQHYVKTDEKEALAAVQNIRIGNGLHDSSLEFKDSQPSFDVRFNKILTSHHFITTTEFLGYFNNQISEVEKEILMIDKKIDTVRSIDRLSKLVNYKELLTGYKEEILDIKQNKEGI